MLEDDLVDSCKPGGRISVVGIYKGMPPRASGVMTGVLKAVVVANSVRQLMREVDRDLSADDIRYALQQAEMLCWSSLGLDYDACDPSTLNFGDACKLAECHQSAHVSELSCL